MEWRLFDPADPPEWTTPQWYAGRAAAPHLEQEGHRERLLATARMTDMAALQGSVSVTDLGAGDGGLLSMIAQPHKIGYDLQQSNVEAAKVRGVNVVLDDVVNPSLSWTGTEWVNRDDDAPAYGPMLGDCVVMAEFLEHLIDPYQMLRDVHANPLVRWLVASSPYTETDLSHYGYHTWAWDVEGYKAMLAACGWRIVATELAWISQIHLAVRT